MECPVLNACLTWALHREDHGYWAGTTPKMRRALRKELGIEYCEHIYLPAYLRLQEERDAAIPAQRQEETQHDTTQTQSA